MSLPELTFHRSCIDKHRREIYQCYDDMIITSHTHSSCVLLKKNRTWWNLFYHIFNWRDSATSVLMLSPHFSVSVSCSTLAESQASFNQRQLWAVQHGSQDASDTILTDLETITQETTSVLTVACFFFFARRFNMASYEFGSNRQFLEGLGPNTDADAEDR